MNKLLTLWYKGLLFVSGFILPFNWLILFGVTRLEELQKERGR